MSSTQTPQNLDYITDPRFRQGLADDLQELEQSMQAGCWKAVHVLAGSVIEAVLVDYLYGLTDDPVKQQRILKLDLAEAATECLNSKVLSKTTHDLCTVVRGYRILIHPGRIVRLSEQVTKEGATIASNLVHLVIKDIAKKQTAEYGFTAQQVVTKLEDDKTNYLVVLDSMLAKMHDREKRRLLLEVLPELHRRYRGYFTEYDEDHDARISETVELVRRTFKLVWDVSGEGIRQQVAKEYYKILQEGSQAERQNIEQGLLMCKFMDYLSPEEVVTMKLCIASALVNEMNKDTLECVNDLGRWLSEGDFTSGVFRLLCDVYAIYSRRKWVRIRDWFSLTLGHMSHDCYTAFKAYTGTYLEEGEYDSRIPVETAKTAMAELSSLDSEIPF